MRKILAVLFGLSLSSGFGYHREIEPYFEFDQLNPVCIIDRINAEENSASEKARYLRILLEVQLDSLEVRDKHYLKRAQEQYESALQNLRLAKSEAEILDCLESIRSYEEKIYSYSERLCVIDEWRTYTSDVGSSSSDN